MVVNNWYVIASMYVIVTRTKLTLIYFVLFYYFCVMIGLNIILAFCIDMYSSIERLDRSQTHHADKLF